MRLWQGELQTISIACFVTFAPDSYYFEIYFKAIDWSQDSDFLISLLADVQGHLIDMVPNTFIQAGRVYLLNFTKIFEKGIRNEDIHKSEAVTATFSGDRSFARFGMIIDFKDTNHDSIDDLVIGSPFRTKDLTEEITGG